NPNSPSPPMAGGDIDPESLTGPVAERVKTILETQVNPAIASHGGMAELVAVEDDTVYLRLGGGCQGCGMATVTLSQGIEATLLQAVPEIKRIVDVTDHSSGQNPYYEAAKK
ncbi:MAG: NifU family protein, partial [Acidimicrobiia bacterium]|nr:NifU family protein [Acidimicrobiia bacterium]